jgi:formylglycine-generating enzyme required for sulfatase activity
MSRSCALTLALLFSACPGGKAPAPKSGAGATPAALPAPVVKIVAGSGRDPVPLALVAAGPFLRGSAQGQGEEDERPQRVIHLDAFYIDQLAVSVAQFRRCVVAKACSVPETEKGCNWGTPGREDHPVNCVSWDQARSYCAWAGKRLPSEAEWEKAARGTDGRYFPWGTQEPTCERANYALGAEKYCHGQTAPVSAHAAAASPWGVRQMAGNVYNWVADWHDKEYYRVSPERNPTGAAVGKYRVVRGGSWFSRAADLRLTMRGLIPPLASFPYVGFRCARSAR